MALSASGSGRGDGGEALKQRIIAFKGLLATRSQRTLARFRTLRVAERPPRSVPTIGLSAAQNRAVGRAEKCEDFILTHSSQSGPFGARKMSSSQDPPNHKKSSPSSAPTSSKKAVRHTTNQHCDPHAGHMYMHMCM